MNGLRIEILAELSGQVLARRLFDITWPGVDGSQITPNLLQAMVHNGAYLSGAFLGEECVGAAFAFPAKGEDGHLHLHSHMAAVLDVHQDKKIGYELKCHQRLWAMEHGYDLITWTFDPLVSRNAHLNVSKLGVEVPLYFRDFYGIMPDAVNAGDASDRVMAYWHLNSRRTKNALKRWLPTTSHAPEVLQDVGGHPVAQEVGSNEREVQVALPADIIEIRTSDLSRAREWRQAVRQALEPRLQSGWKIIGFTQDRSYVVEAPHAH